jgi:hypothetical protein
MNSIIYDENAIKMFLSLLPELKGDEVRFVSLSARNKYLTDEEKLKYQLSKTEMFFRKIIRNDDHFLNTIKKMDAIIPAYKTKSGLQMPKKASVCYFNINPSSTIKAYNMFIHNMSKFQHELLMASLNSKCIDTMMTKMKRGDIEYLNCIQKSRGSKHFIDIDFDIDKHRDIDILNDFTDILFKENVVYYIIETHGGFHVLIKLNTLSNKFNLYKHIKHFDKIIKSKGKGEVIINKNAMIPLPGTYQAGFKVKLHISD